MHFALDLSSDAATFALKSLEKNFQRGSAMGEMNTPEENGKI